MKRLFLALLVWLVLVVPAFGAGTVTQTLDWLNYEHTEAVLTFSWTADSSDGTVPSTAVSASILARITGMWVFMATTNPGTTAPTDNYDIAINDADGIDMFGGAVGNRDEANSEQTVPIVITGGTIYGSRIVTGTFSFVLTNNSVNSATGTCKIFLTK